MVNLRRSPIESVLAATLLILIVYLITNSEIAIYCAVAVGVLGLLFDSVAKAVHRLWTTLTWVLGLVVPNILLALIFYFFLTPIALLAKFFGNKNQLNLKNTHASLFGEQKDIFDKAFFERPW